MRVVQERHPARETKTNQISGQPSSGSAVMMPALRARPAPRIETPGIKVSLRFLLTRFISEVAPDTAAQRQSRRASVTAEDARRPVPAALQPPSSSLGELVYHSEGSGQGQSGQSGQSQSPRRTFSPARTAGRFRFLPESLKTMPVPPLFPSARNRANAPTAPNDDEDALDLAPDSPLSPSGRTKRSPKAKAMSQSFYLDRPKPKPRLHQGGASGEQLHLLTIEGFEAPKRDAANELPSPSSSMKRMVLQDTCFFSARSDRECFAWVGSASLPFG